MARLREIPMDPCRTTYQAEDGREYTLDEIDEIIHQYSRFESIRRNICTALCGLHLMAGVLGILFMDAVGDHYILLLLAVLYCFAGAALFAGLANDGSDL